MRISHTILFLFSLAFLCVLPSSATAEDCGTFIPEPPVSNFVLVLDRSGSMAGEPLEDAKQALAGFIGSMRDGDRASLVSFESNVRLDLGFTGNRNDLVDSVMRLGTGNMTRFYDAVAKASQLLSREKGLKAVIFLTDGNDNMSGFSLRDIRDMNIGEGIFVYGIGLGDVDHGSLEDLTAATGGEYRIARSSRDLYNLYNEVQSRYYQRFSGSVSDTGSFTVTSVPAGRPVTVDGVSVGRTPVRIDSRPAGRYDIRVEFLQGTWQCLAESRPGFRNSIKARETDLPTDLIVESAPTGAAVFIDGAYVGLTALMPSRKTSGGRDYSGQLRVPSLSPGVHHIRIVAVPDVDFSGSQVMEFDFTMARGTRYVKALVFMGRAEFGNGEVITVQRDPVGDALKRLDSLRSGTVPGTSGFSLND